jgi:bacterioferritin
MDREKVVKKLNQALERELAEVVKYMHQSFWVQPGPRRKKMVAFCREQSMESMGHATRLGEKIVAMGGVPVVKILEIYTPKAQSVKEMLLECAEDERKAKEGYEAMLPLVAGDKELTKLIKGLAREEAGHMAEIATMARKI